MNNDKRFKQNYTVGILGLSFNSANKGCEALGYGFLNVLESAVKNHDIRIHVLIFEQCSIDDIYRNGDFDHLQLSSVVIPGIGSLSHIMEHINNYKKCDIVFDYTEGDSFSDIYGMRRFFVRSFIKQLVEWSGTPLVLGSQTYGPYKTLFAKLLARHLIKNATAVYSRDAVSHDRVKKLTQRDSDVTVDVSFAMPYKTVNTESKKIRVGINPSGLLWAGGYTKDNQFGLTVDYRRYCREIIAALIETDEYELFLVPHVISSDYSNVDNDTIACEELKAEFGSLTEPSYFDTPMDVKSFISTMDFFIGARMHACIAAFTTSTPFVPFSYSPKFEGLFHSLGYDHVISATRVTTDRAIIETLDMIRKREALFDELQLLKPKISKGVAHLVDETRRLIIRGAFVI